MKHNQETSIEPINISSSKFGVRYENQFAVLNDAKHVIGIDPNDGKNLILENIENRKADEIGWSDSSRNLISTLFYDKNTGYLYSGDLYSRLCKFKVSTTSKSCERVKDFGEIGIGRISTSCRFLHFVFFGGSNYKIRVLDLSTGDLFLEHLETSIRSIWSLQVFVKSQDQIYLTVSGDYPDYSQDKTDLFDLTDFLQVDSMILQKYL